MSQYHHFKTDGQQEHFGIKNEQVTETKSSGMLCCVDW